MIGQTRGMVEHFARQASRSKLATAGLKWAAAEAATDAHIADTTTNTRPSR